MSTAQPRPARSNADATAELLPEPLASSARSGRSAEI
jgi:hypothetical protein